VAVVTGEPGIGKTALLDWLAAVAADLRVIRTTGVPQETDFMFGGLHQVLTPLLPYSGCLPSPQRQALQVELALDAGPAPDRFLVYLAALTLITEAAQHHPLLVVVDDFQWLDQQSTEALAFAARRVLADSVAFVFSLRREVADPHARSPDLCGKSSLPGTARSDRPLTPPAARSSS
jgi:AAA ATPase domain